MSIQILPPQLANQIAAGEVVERPSSVVKELVENALDAGADNIEIEIDKGGHKRILIRDNGKGIDKEQLTLALSRHATSKIVELDDLEAIVSLGFRGEALASISSVSRLTLSSKPQSQSQAWAAIAEGLDMTVTVKPAAHPNGTSVEVLDLFFNTPARRKFLRAEKTEFSHIEQLIKRIALSRSDVSFVLKHNGRLVKRYRSQAGSLNQQTQVSNRISEVIGKAFVANAQYNSVVYDEVDISVWVKQPELCIAVNPAQYCFVNGRMMRDKLLQHAIRQAFADKLDNQQQPEYVLFIQLPAKDVDVNVHPAKHEVRFHYARLLHDLLVRTITESLLAFEPKQLLTDEIVNSEPALTGSTDPNQPDWLVTPQQIAAPMPNQPIVSAPRPSTTRVEETSLDYSGLKPVKQAASASYNLQHKPTAIPVQQATNLESATATEGAMPTGVHSAEGNKGGLLQLLHLQDGQYAYILFEGKMRVCDLLQLEQCSQVVGQFDDNHWLPMPLLVPIRIRVSEQEKQQIMQLQDRLAELGFEFKLHQAFMIIKTVPAILRENKSTTKIPSVFEQLLSRKLSTSESIKTTIINNHSAYLSYAEAQTIIAGLQSSADKLNQFKALAMSINPAELLG